MIICASMLLLGFASYIVFDTRAFQLRFFWPNFITIFFGLAIYALLKFFVKKWNILHSIILSIIFTILFTGLVKMPFVQSYIPYYEKLSTPGVMNPYHWEVLNWFPKNTDENAKIYFFYGNIYSQDALLRNSKRTHYQVDPEDIISAINNKEIKRKYVTESPGDGGGGTFYRTSFFKFGNYAEEQPEEFFFGKKDICSFDYYIFDKVSRQQVLAQYNLLIASELLQKDFVSKVFENQVAVILKNNNPGADCIEERKFE